MSRQLAFDLPMREARGRADFFVSPANATALAAIERWRDWPQGKLVLMGPAGSGKTHLAHVWATLTDASVVDAGDLGGADLPELAARGAVCVENADHGLSDERALFHLHNLLAEAGGALMITARTPPRDWGLSLPDLQSRLFAAPVASLAAPDDALLRAVLLKQFADRQVIVSPTLVDWLIPRIERSFEAVQDAVERLDSASLSESRPLTRALAARVLDIKGPSGA